MGFKPIFPKFLFFLNYIHILLIPLILFQVSGNPRNDRLHGKTFLKVERQVENGGWETVYTDAHWDTKLV